MTDLNVRVAFTRAARTAGDNVPTTSGRRKNTKSLAERTQRFCHLVHALAPTS